MSDHPSGGRGVPHGLPIDPDLDTTADVRDGADAQPGRFTQAGRGRWPRLEGPVLAVIFAGGIAGGLARYAATSVWPTPAGGFPWATFAVNIAGAFALALLVFVLAEIWSPHRHTRALVGTGFLGAFTTFSSVATTADELAAHGHAGTAVLYLAGSVVAAWGASSSGLLLGRAILTRRQRGGDDQNDGDHQNGLP